MSTFSSLHRDSPSPPSPTAFQSSIPTLRASIRGGLELTVAMLRKLNCLSRRRQNGCSNALKSSSANTAQYIGLGEGLRSRPSEGFLVCLYAQELCPFGGDLLALGLAGIIVPRGKAHSNTQDITSSKGNILSFCHSLQLRHRDSPSQQWITLLAMLLRPRCPVKQYSSSTDASLFMHIANTVVQFIPGLEIVVP